MDCLPGNVHQNAMSHLARRPGLSNAALRQASGGVTSPGQCALALEADRDQVIFGRMGRRRHEDEDQRYSIQCAKVAGSSLLHLVRRCHRQRLYASRESGVAPCRHSRLRICRRCRLYEPRVRSRSLSPFLREAREGLSSWLAQLAPPACFLTWAPPMECRFCALKPYRWRR